MNIDPKAAFYFGLIIFVAGVVGNAGANFFAGALPAASIPPLIKWCAIVSTLGNGVMTYIAGQNMTQAGRLQNARQVPLPVRMDSLADNNTEVKQIVTTQALADATNSDKIVGPKG